MSKLGFEPFGKSGPFGGAGLISILGVSTVASNEAIVVFDVPPLSDDPYAFNSATNVKNWTLTPVDPTVTSTIPGSPGYLPSGSTSSPTRSPIIARIEVDENDPRQLSIFTDSRLEAEVAYDLEMQPSVIGLDCEVQSGPTAFRFIGVRAGPPRRSRYEQRDKYRDWSYEFFPDNDERVPGTWNIDDSGDISIQNADESLRKRILRRISSERGSFVHIPGYGTALKVKELARAGRVQEMANQVAEQVRSEPDVVHGSCSATISRNGLPSSVVSLKIFVVRRGNEESKFLIQFPLA